MSVKPLTSTAGQPSTYFPDPFGNQFRVSAKIDLDAWLKRVCYHAESGAPEDQSSLIELAQNLPENYELAPKEVKEVVEKIIAVAKDKKWDPTLSPSSYKAIHALAGQLSPTPEKRPVCATSIDLSEERGDFEY